MWLTHTSYKDIVQNAWKVDTQGSHAFRLRHKISNVKKYFIDCNKKVFGKVEREIKNKQQKLQEIQDFIQAMAGIKFEGDLREEVETLMLR